MAYYESPMSDKESQARHEAMEKRVEELAKKAPKNPVAKEIRGMRAKQERESGRRVRWNGLQPIFSEACEQFVEGKISWEEALSSIIELLDLERDR